MQKRLLLENEERTFLNLTDIGDGSKSDTRQLGFQRFVRRASETLGRLSKLPNKLKWR